MYSMKNIVIYSLILCSFLVACNAQESNGKDENNEKTGKKITKRDISITKANAYNDLFLDSAAVENFIAQDKVPDSIARRIRSFYNARNFQFAWFSSQGLTEPARGFWNLHDNHTTYSDDTLLKDKTL